MRAAIAAAALALVVACAPDESCNLELAGTRGSELELAGVQDAIQTSLEDAGYPRDATCSFLRGGRVDVAELEDGGAWTDSQFFTAEEYFARVRCTDGATRARFIVSRADFRNSELPLQVVYAMTGCNPDRSWWAAAGLEDASAEALIASHQVQPLSGATGDTQ